MDWSVVVHAYGNPLQTNWQLRQPYQAYTFADLGYVTQFQQSWLRNLSVANPAIAPQAMLAASEQGWDTGSPNTARKPPLIEFDHALQFAGIAKVANYKSHTWFCDSVLKLSLSQPLLPNTYANATPWRSMPAITWSS